MELSLQDLRQLVCEQTPRATVPRDPEGLNAYVGRNVFVRTVTHYYTGRLVRHDNTFMTLEDAAWIADTGRFSKALTEGVLGEVEPFPGECLVSLGATLDVSPWNHDLPRVVK